jgi:hypothetical protein
MDYERWRVSIRSKRPLIQFIETALEASHCRIIRSAKTGEAPFRFSFETPDGERLGVIAYAFLANRKETKNRPSDEHRFQVKYGSKDGRLHQLWQDPFGMYTTVFCGINPEAGFCVGVDPVLHSPTRFFISVEFKDSDIDAVLLHGWHAWERTRRAQGLDEPVDVLVGVRPEHFLRFIRFERAAKGLAAGHRMLLAEKMVMAETASATGMAHSLAKELSLETIEIMDLIQSAPRLKMAVRGWVAEVHLQRLLQTFPSMQDCERIEQDGQPDLRVRAEDGTSVRIECKNALRKTRADGRIQVDFQRTRASKNDPCTRFYRPSDFELLAACLHPCTEQWDFRFIPTLDLDAHAKCSGRLSNRVVIDERWIADPLEAILAAKRS